MCRANFHCTGDLTDGKLIWEYPCETPDEQMEFVEAMALNDRGFIQRHRV